MEAVQEKLKIDPEKIKLAERQKLLNDIKNLTPEQKALLAIKIQEHPKTPGTLQKVKSVAGAFWNGWEKGVNGALDGTVHLFKATGTWIGETAAKIISTGEGKEVLDTTVAFWKGQVNKILAMTPEERAKLAGEGLAFVATAVVGAKGLNTVGKTGVMARELSLGKSAFAKGTGKAISEGGQIGMEVIGGNRTEKTRANLHPNKPDRIFVEANAALKPADRIAKAEELLGKKFTQEEKRAILKAHNHGDNKIYEYTHQEINKKTRALEEAGFNKEERRKLMENGIVGNEIKEGTKNIKERILHLEKQIGVGKEFRDTVTDSIDTALQGNGLEKIQQTIQILSNSKNPRMGELINELEKILSIVQNRKPKPEQISTSITKPKPRVTEIMEIDEALKGSSHRGRIERLTELFSHGHPTKETFAISAQQRLLEAEKYLDYSVQKKWITQEEHISATNRFLQELRKATQSHVSEEVPKFKNVEEALGYLKILNLK